MTSITPSLPGIAVRRTASLRSPVTRQSMLIFSMKRLWIYILASRPRGTLYVGVTSDLIRRVQQHRKGFVDGLTKQHSVKMLVHYKEYATAFEAIQREKYQALATQVENRFGPHHESRLV